MQLLDNPTEPNIIKRLAARSNYTPDFSTLRFYKKIPVFVYGNEKRRGIYNSLLKGGEYLGRAVTCGNTFGMKERHDNAIVFYEDGHQCTRGKVMGELYHVSVEGLHMVDIMHLNTVMKYRQVVNIQLLDQFPDFCRKFGRLPVTQGLMYLGYKEKFKDFSMTDKGLTRYPNDEQLKGYPFFEHIIYREAAQDSFFDIAVRRGIYDPDESDERNEQAWLNYRENYGGVRMH